MADNESGELPTAPEWAIALANKVEEGFALQDGRFTSLETALEIVVENEKTFNKRLSDLQSRLEQIERGASRAGSSARFRVLTAQEIEVATSTSDIIEKSRELCKRVRSWASATHVKIRDESLITELEEALSRYDILRQKP